MLALTVALVGPYFVDWTSYRADFEREAGRILGRQVEVQGTATARLLPFPSVTFTDVVVAGAEPGEHAMTVETFSMDAELAPFMRGDIHIFDMRLVRPTVLVDIADDGALDWAVRPSVPVGADHISLEKLTVTEGRAAIRHAASGRTHTLTEINAEMSARSIAGPWRMEGSLRLDGMLTNVSVSTGAVDAAGGMRLRVRAQPERYPVTLEADGNARVEDGRARYAGNFRLNAAAQGAEQQAEPGYRLSGLFDFDHAALTVGEFRFETGTADDPYVAEGSAEFTLGVEPRFLIRADGAQIRFDDATAEGQAGGFDLRQRLAAVREFLLDMPRPTIPGRIEVALPAIVAGDTTVRDVHLHAEPADAGWKVSSLGATLPGRATLEASGNLTLGEDAAFSGSLLLAVGQPSGFAAWLARDVDDAIRRLPAAGFSARVRLSDESQTFRDLELMLGGAKFTGEIDSRTPADAKPSMTMRLDGDRLDVEGMAAFASLFVSDGGHARLADRDLEFEIRAGPVSVAGLTAETLDTALRLKDATLEIDRLAIGGLAGANVSATGTIRSDGASPAATLDATVVSADLGPLVETLAARFPDNPAAGALARRAARYPGLLEDASIRATLDAGSGAGGTVGMSLDAQGEAGGTAFTLTAATDDAMLGIAGAPLTVELSASNDEAAALYALAGLPALPLGLAGAAQLDLAFDGAVGGGGWTRFGFSGDGLTASFEGEAALNGGVFSANGASELDTGDIDPWLAAAGLSLPGFGLGLPVRLSAGLDVGEGVLVLSNLGGEVAGYAVDGDLNAQLRDGLPHLTGALSLASFDLGPVAELAVGADAIAASADGWPTAPFAAQPRMPVTADVELAAETLFAGNFMRARDARLALRLSREGFSVSDADMQAFGGRLTGIVDFRNDGGTGLVSGQLRLSGADAVELLGDTGLSGDVDVTASLTSHGKSIDGIVAALSGSGSAHLRGIAIEGIDPAAFGALLQEADGLGTQVDAAAVHALAAERVRDGVFHADGVDVAFTVANGTLRAPPIRLEAEGAALAAELQADLGAGEIQAGGLLTYDPGLDALVGSEPAVRFTASGPLAAIEVAVDTEPLAQYLTQRALEREQQRVEAMQAGLLERQRHRREVRYYAALDTQRRESAEEARRAEEEVQRLERLRRQSEEERARREEEAGQRLIEEHTRLEAEEAERARLAAGRPVADAAIVPLANMVDVVPEPAPRAAAPSEARRAFSVEEILRALEETH